MEDVRQLVQEEGREARNLVAFHVAVDTPNRVARKPPRGAPPPRCFAPRSQARLRSASAGRDKRSELRARYWALLFGDLQRAVGEIYNTVEAHENQNECQEVILVLENYTRDFKALSEWFKLKWEYDNTPPPQRPQSLAWEIRKTDFVRPESRRTHSVKSSPSVSGKNSPCLSGHNTPSGKNSPNLTGKASPGSGKISPRISGHSNTSPKGSIEFFSNKIASKTATKPEPKAGKETRLSDIKEKETVLIDVEKKDVPKEKEDKQTVTFEKDNKTPESPLANGPKNTKDVKVKESVPKDLEDKEKTIHEINKDRDILLENISKEIESTKVTVQGAETTKERQNINVLKDKEGKESPKHLIEIGKAKEIPNATPKPVIVKTRQGKIIKDDKRASSVTEVSSQATFTASKLDAMENEFLAKNLTENAAKNENLRNEDIEKDSNLGSKVTETYNGPHKEAKSTEEPESNLGSNSNDSLQSPLSFAVITKVDDTRVDVTAIPELKPKAVSTKKTLVKKDFVSKVGKESPAKDAKVLETKEKKESIKKATKESESIKKEEPTKDQMMKDQKVNWAEECEVDLIKNKEDKGSCTDEKQEFLSDTIKLETKSPESVKEDVKKDTKEDVKENKKEDKKEDKDLKKSEAKSTDVRPPKPAYSQAAAKPKLVTTKDENKTPTKTLYRSKTVVEIRPSSAPNSQLRQFSNRNQKSKCSYPFNLTTGRTSLFDTPGAPKVIATKRPISRPQMAAGDAKNQIKLGLKTRPPRPDSLKLNEEEDKQEKIKPSFEKMKDCDEYSSSDTIVTQIDLSRIESSESLKTIVPDVNDVANSIEVLNVDGDKTDNDGWLTVKSRRLSRESKKSKSHWANRFHQPSATTSLPTLNMIESPKSETNPIIDSKLDRAKSEQPQNKPEKIVKVTDQNESKANAKDTSMIRQKSDVTGLKTRSSRNKAFKKEKNRDKKDSELTKNRLHSSLESLTTGLARSQESTEQDGFDFDKWKAEFMTTFKCLEEDFQITNHNEILKSADPTEMSEIAEMTSQIEENERKISLALDFQTEVDQQKLCREEDILNRQIMELQQVSDNDLDTETDDTETDAEILCEDSAIGPCQSSDNLTCRDLASCLENHYESALEGMSWSERLDMLGALEELVARDPEAFHCLIQGRAQQLHAKLSQGIKRRGSLQDVLRKLQAKQARAEKQRMLLHTKRAKKIHHLLARVEEVKIAKKQLIDEKKNRMERRLQKAAENRDQHLKDIVRKAHDEEEKLREIAFIKQLEAENRRHEFLEQCRSLNTRLREMRREQLDKLEQKTAREAAVGARRQALEAARKLHVESLLEKKKERDARREELKELKRQERDDAAREKAEGVKSRLSALAAAAELEADALRSRIRDKQDASQQRLESHLQAIREKATGPRQPTTSETHDQNSAASKEQDELIDKLEQDRKDRERQKVLRKKARKLKQKIIATSKASSFGYTHPMQTLFNPIAGKTQRVINHMSALLAPHIPDYGANIFSYDTTSLKMKITEDEKQDFKYDFEDKMGKKKKRKRNQEAQNNNQSQKNQNLKGNTPKKESKQKNEEQTNRKPPNDVQKLANDTQKSPNESQKLTNDALKQTNDAEQSNDSKPTKAGRESSFKPNGIPNHENDDTSQKNANETQKDRNDEQNTQTVNEAQRLSKSNSICSSVSDRSTFVTTTAKLDIPQLEKLINELYRLSTIKDCNDNLKPKPKFSEFPILTQLQILKTLAQLLCLLAERDDLLAQISVKCVTICVVICSRVMVSGGACALYVFTSPFIAHAISLLNNQLSKDLSDPREMELAKHLTDLISFALDAALCETRLRPYNGEPNSPVTSLRTRALNLISYLCMSGCLARAEHAGEACERLQTLVTLCADICQPHKADVGPDRASAVQSLRVALGTGLMGSRAEFCMLFAAGAELSRSRDFVRAARTAHLLRQLAELDHQLVQDAFGEGGWPLEFRAAVARLLSQHAPSDKEAPSSGTSSLNSQRLDVNLSEHMVLDLIVLVGYVVVANPQLNETICDNWGVIKTLCTLPANWLVSETHSPALLPTLAVLAEHAPTAKVISSELSLKMLETFIDSPEGQKIKLIEILKASRDKVAKKDKQGKKEKQNSTEGTDNQTNGTRYTAKDVNIKEALTNGVKGNRASNNSDDEV